MDWKINPGFAKMMNRLIEGDFTLRVNVTHLRLSVLHRGFIDLF